MRWVYTILLYFATPFIMLRLLWRSFRLPAYRKRWSERFGWYSCSAVRDTVWVHAVSVGEVIAVLPMIRALIARYPEHTLVVTTTTPTGSMQVTKHLANRVVHVYMPYDLPIIVRRFLAHFQPKIAIIMETELWPNVLRVLKQQRVPVLLANARLSDRSKKGYQRIASLSQSMLGCFSAVAAQSVEDGQRFVDLGLSKARLFNTGNLKFDLTLPPDINSKAEKIRAALGERYVWLAASTHEGEEVLLLEVFAKLYRRYPKLLFILVPRHPDRFEKIYKLCTRQFAHVARRSRRDEITDKTQILLLDTMGELPLFYASSDQVFMAGSLVPVGGHNFLEPAALGRPILTGHHLHNFRYVSRLLLDAKALGIVDNTTQLMEKVMELIENPSLAAQMGVRARAVVESNQGALNKHLDVIHQLIGEQV